MSYLTHRDVVHCHDLGVMRVLLLRALTALIEIDLSDSILEDCLLEGAGLASLTGPSALTRLDVLESLWGGDDLYALTCARPALRAFGSHGREECHAPKYCDCSQYRTYVNERWAQRDDAARELMPPQEA